MLGLTIKVSSALYKVFIYRIAELMQLYKFWDTIQNKLPYGNLYTTSIRAMRLKLLKLLNNDKEVKKLKVEELLKRWKNIKKILYY